MHPEHYTKTTHNNIVQDIIWSDTVPSG
jgi:hypothetical protein